MILLVEEIAMANPFLLIYLKSTEIPFLVRVLLQIENLQELQKVPQELQDLMKDNRVNRETLFKQRGVENYVIEFWALEQVRIHRGK